ncbi:hypothetical protein [Nocardia gipuzkoensis]|uniref:hypothetical protein n=1 Tax=Nocardia gipuzkoensis TaxID=2749991 RepID=UPI003EE2A22E
MTFQTAWPSDKVAPNPESIAGEQEIEAAFAFRLRAASDRRLVVGRESWSLPRDRPREAEFEGDAFVRGFDSTVEFMVSREVTTSVVHRALNLMRYLFSPNTIYASIAPEDNGLVFYWTAAGMAIEIDVCADGTYWWGVKDVAGESYSGESRRLPVQRLRHSLNMFSKEVDSANPRWRDAFQQLA